MTGGARAPAAFFPLLEGLGPEPLYSVRDINLWIEGIGAAYVEELLSDPDVEFGRAAMRTLETSPFSSHGHFIQSTLTNRQADVLLGFSSVMCLIGFKIGEAAPKECLATLTQPALIPSQAVTYQL